MSPRPAPVPRVTFLGIEGGGTRTVALLADAHGRLLHRRESGPANLRLLTDAELVAHLRQIATDAPHPDAIGIGLAGAREEADRARIRQAAAQIWPGIPCWAGNDLDTAFAVAQADRPAGSPAPAATVVLVSGTGSCCFGLNARGRAIKVGGWGHLLGDRGSGYDLALTALRAVVAEFDRTGKWPAMGAQFLSALLLNEPNDLVTWLHGASKADVAAQVRVVFEAAIGGDRLARQIIAGGAAALGADAVRCAHRLAPPGARVEFVLTGGVLRGPAVLARPLTRNLRRGWPGASVRTLTGEGAWGAVHLARVEAATRSNRAPTGTPPLPMKRCVPRQIPDATDVSPTERRNPRSTRLDRLPVIQAIELMLAEEAKTPAILRRQRDVLARLVLRVARALRHGGRLYYVGAGTSGRLGVLDASECPPTFRTEPDQVQGIIAGGVPALWRSIEGAEDDFEAGSRSVEFRQVHRGDVVIGIAASGRTPFVWGALSAARHRGTVTALLAFNPHLCFARGTRPDFVITPDLGPEILTGSTRLKAGTATKVVLNIITTLAMVQLGKVVGNLMVDLNPSNVKLRARAERIVQELRGVDQETAHAALERANWNVKSALRQPVLQRRKRK